MMRKPSFEDKSTTPFAVALWLWTAVAAIGTAIAFGNAFADGGGSALGVAFGGLIVGAFSTIPFWALYGLGKHVLHNLIRLREDLAAQPTQ